MIVAPNKSWCYLGPPKTGSTTLVNLLQKPPFNGIYNGFQHDMVPPDDVPFVFASIRSPWTRILSLWKHRRVELLKPEEDRIAIHQLKQNRLPFDKFIAQVFSKCFDNFFYRTICDWLDEGPNDDCHFVRLEHLHHDLSILLPQYNWDEVVVPRLNDTDRVVYDNNPLARQSNRNLVWRWAQRDFLRFKCYHIPYDREVDERNP